MLQTLLEEGKRRHEEREGMRKRNRLETSITKEKRRESPIGNEQRF